MQYYLLFISNIIMLTLGQSREYNRCQRLHTYFSINSPVFNTYIPFSEEVENYNTNFTRFQSYVPNKGATGTGITTGQKDLKLKIGRAIADICEPACAYANKYNNSKLAADVCYKKSNIQRLKDGDILGIVIRIANALAPLASDTNFMKYQITSQMVTDIMTDATVFNNNIGKASMIDTDSNIANQNINDVIKSLKENIKTFDRLINKFAATHPDFVTGYKLNAVTDNTGVHHNGFEGTVTSAAAGEPIKDARISIEGKDKMTASDLLGYYELIKLRPGDYEVSFSAEGYTSKVVMLRIARGKMTKADITL